MMWITGFPIMLLCFPGFQAADLCKNLVSDCTDDDGVFRPGCYEDKVATCTTSRSRRSGFIRMKVNSSDKEATRDLVASKGRVVHIPSSALKRSIAAGSEENVLVIVSVLNSTLFTQKPSTKSRRLPIPNQSAHSQGTVLGQSVVQVRVGHHAVRNLSQPIILTFTHNNQTGDGKCMFWKDFQGDGRGTWDDEGCKTVYNERDFICSCDHLSFFAVLVNPKVSVARVDAGILRYINLIGSALSVFFTIISLVIYMRLQRARPEKTISVHMQLTGALFCLHLSYLLSGLWGWLWPGGVTGWGCRAMGLLLHWSLLATFSWMALEGFHLYMLLIRVFNIYVRRYLLKLGLVGWGVPTVVAVTCGILNFYGKYSTAVNDDNNSNNNTSDFELCWISNDASIPGSAERHTLVIYITVVAYLGLLLLFNAVMLGVVVVKLWQLRDNGRGCCGSKEGRGSWKRLQKERQAQLWKDCATVSGLSVVLGLPWGLACTTYISSHPGGLYLFTTLNSLQGFFMFLWSVALTCKSQADTSTTSSSTKDPSTQKMMETSFNNSH